MVVRGSSVCENENHGLLPYQKALAVHSSIPKNCYSKSTGTSFVTLSGNPLRHLCNAVH